MGINAFCKTGNTITFTAGVVAPTPVQCSSTTLGGNQYRIINAGTSLVFWVMAMMLQLLILLQLM